jgi:NADH-quinone oxidoreductase subunit G
VKLKAVLVSDIASISGLTSKSVILVGERLGEKVGGLSAAVDLAEKSGAKLAWIPRRAGERGAIASGAIATLLPGGRPVSQASARVDVAAAWAVDSLPTNPGRSTSEILHALIVNNLDAVVIGGVDPLDISNTALSQLLNSFVVSLEITHSAVTAVADVVLPVAAVIEKSGSFQDWQGSARAFEKALSDSLSRSDVRILSMIADEMGTPINLPTVAATAREIAALGNWDGAAISFEKTSAAKAIAAEGKMNLNSWRLLLDLGTLQDGEANLAGTARKASARISKTRAEKIGVSEGELISISSDLGSLKLPVEISEMSDNDIWVPRNSIDSQVIANLGFVSGQVTVVKA